MVLRMRFEPYVYLDGSSTSTGGVNFASGMKLYEDPSSPQGNNPNTDVTTSGYYLEVWINGRTLTMDQVDNIGMMMMTFLRVELM